MLPASFIQRFWRNVATYVINLCVVFAYRLVWLGAEGLGHTQKGSQKEHDVDRG